MKITPATSKPPATSTTFPALAPTQHHAQADMWVRQNALQLPASKSIRPQRPMLLVSTSRQCCSMLAKMGIIFAKKIFPSCLLSTIWPFSSRPSTLLSTLTQAATTSPLILTHSSAASSLLRLILLLTMLKRSNLSTQLLGVKDDPEGSPSPLNLLLSSLSLSSLPNSSSSRANSSSPSNDLNLKGNLSAYGSGISASMSLHDPQPSLCSSG